MVNKDFIAGLAIGAIRYEKDNISGQEYPFVEWIETSKYIWMLRIKYNCSICLNDLDEMEIMVSSFCNVNSIVVGETIDIYINIDKDTK